MCYENLISIGDKATGTANILSFLIILQEMNSNLKMRRLMACTAGFKSSQGSSFSWESLTELYCVKDQTT